MTDNSLQDKLQLVLGANGFIGSSIVERFVREKIPVRAFSRSFSAEFISRFPQVERVQGDFETYSGFAGLLSNVSTVHHLVSSTTPASSHESPALDAQINIVANRRFLQAMSKSTVTKIVFASSGGTVYGKQTTKLIRENHVTNPECYYGVSKLAIEKDIHIAAMGAGFQYVILRISNPYGPNQSSHRQQGMVGVLFNRIRLRESLQLWGDGDVVRDFVHIDDVANAFYKATLFKGSCATFNIGTGLGHSIEELIEKISVLTKTAPHVETGKARIFDVDRNVLDSTLANVELGWCAEIDLDSGLKSTMALLGL